MVTLGFCARLSESQEMNMCSVVCLFYLCWMVQTWCCDLDNLSIFGLFFNSFLILWSELSEVHINRQVLNLQVNFDTEFWLLNDFLFSKVKHLWEKFD